LQKGHDRRKSRDRSGGKFQRNGARHDEKAGRGAKSFAVYPYRASVAVALRGGDSQASLLARAHVNEAVVPSLDDLSGLIRKHDLAPSKMLEGIMTVNDTYLALAQGEFKGLVAVQARVELAPIFVEGARIVH